MDEEAIIAAVLSHLWSGPKYTVVLPETSFCRLNLQNADELNRASQYLVAKLQAASQTVTPLIDRFFAVNQTSTLLSLEPAPEKGYLVDHEGVYQRYFGEDGGGWERWYGEHPDADGETEVSRPVYDDQTGNLLIYVGTQTHSGAGSGHVLLFRYVSGELEEVARVMAWVC